MSFAVNPLKGKRSLADTEAAAAAKQQRADRERIRRLLITLGDDNKKVVGQIRGLAGALEDDVELHGDLMIETLLECAKCLPMKTSIYAAWAMRMGEKHPSWARSLPPRLVDELRLLLRTGRAAPAQVLLKFVAALGSYGFVGLGQVMSLLEDVAALSTGLRPAKGGDLGVFLVLATLPFLSPAAHAQAADRVDRLIQGATSYVTGRGSSHWTPILRFVKSEDVCDRMEALPDVLASQRRASWSSSCALHVPGFEPSEEGKLEGVLMPRLEVTAEEIRKSKVRLQVPLVATRLLSIAPEKHGADDHMPCHDRWVLEDQILLTIDSFGRDVDECAKQLLKIPVLHPQFEVILVEVVFSQMLRLPTPPELPLFYSRLLESIMEKQTTTKTFVDQYYRALFTHASDLDEECLEVLAEAFAYHLMHTNFQADWSPFIGGNLSVSAQRLIRRTLDRLQRLSFHQNLLHRLPESLHVYVPPEPQAATTLPVQKRNEYTEMLSVVRIKDGDEEQVVEFCDKLRGRSRQQKADGPADSEEVRAAKKRRVEGDDAGDATGKAPAVEASDGGGAAVADDVAAKEAAEGGEAQPIEGGQVGEAEPPVNPKEGKEESTVKPKDEVKEEPQDEPVVATKPAAEVPQAPWEPHEVAELFAVALLQNGSKTPTHMSKLLDAYRVVFSKLRPDDDEQAHEYEKLLVGCVADVWRCASQRLEITVDALLQRGIVECRAVVERILAGRGPQGCDSLAAWNIVNSVARKSLEQSQSARVELAMAKKLGQAEASERCRAELDKAISQSAEVFTVIFTSLVRNHQDFEEADTGMRQVMASRILAIGRKYHAFIRPLIDAAESRIPGVAHNPDIAAIFESLRAL